MSNNLIPVTSGMEVMSLRQARSTGRQLARMNASTDMRIRMIENEADVHVAKVDAIGYVAERAMFSTATVTQVEQQLGQMFPMAVSRLQALADMHALAAVEIVADTRLRLRRA